MPNNADQLTRNSDRYGREAIGAVIQQSVSRKGDGWTLSSYSGLMCPHKECDCGGHTHVVDVVWERDPSEGDRRWVRLEVRCESGRGYLLLIRNHGGHTRFEYKLIDGEVSPFAEGVRW